MLNRYYADVKRSIERLADRRVIQLPPLADEQFSDKLGRPCTDSMYRINTKDDPKMDHINVKGIFINRDTRWVCKRNFAEPLPYRYFGGVREVYGSRLPKLQAWLQPATHDQIKMAGSNLFVDTKKQKPHNQTVLQQ